ncbi:MAG: hypothetical protein IJU94_01305 [Clostridia bacterium]|nr:hypothetical protein [Clostridia bacterium]
MKRIDYCIFDPTGNITALAETPVPAEGQPAAAAELMKAEPSVEQVGFVSGAALRMAGGEFCGNGAACAAALRVMRGEAEGEVSVAVSGAAAPVAVKVTARGGGGFGVAVAMPRAVSVGLRVLPLCGGEAELPVVSFGGISHIILEKEIAPSDAERAIIEWSEALGGGAVGIMTVDSDFTRMTPLVCVPGAGTLVRESSCASGAAAVAEYYGAKNGFGFELELAQPGGTARVSGGPEGVVLSETVRFLKKVTVAGGNYVDR